MELSIISFTQNGIALSKKLALEFTENKISLFTKCNCGAEECVPKLVEQSVGDWAREQMQEKNALLFIGACGIAIRAIAPCLSDKLHDSPVIVMDERGEYVIPILSGHVGGANEIARQIAKKLGATPVITTATDINDKFAVDLFAKKNGLHIANKDGIAKVSAKVLVEKKIMISIEPGHIDENSKIPEEIQLVSYPPEQFVDVVVTAENREFDAALCLRPKEYVIGMGCKRGKEAAKIDALIQKSLKETGIFVDQIFALASIDKKKDEEGFLAWSRTEKIPFLTYAAGQLQELEGIFQTSEFVKEQVGVDNVCERAALLACGWERKGNTCKSAGRLIYEKHAEDGMTIAIAKREWSVVFDEE